MPGKHLNKCRQSWVGSESSHEGQKRRAILDWCGACVGILSVVTMSRDFFSRQRQASRGLYIWSKASSSLSAALRLGEKRRLLYSRLSLWHDCVGAGRQAVALAGCMDEEGKGFKDITWELVQRRKVRVSSLFVSNCKKRFVWGGSTVRRGNDNSLWSTNRPHSLPPPTHYLCVSFHPPCLLLAHSPSLPFFRFM